MSRPPRPKSLSLDSTFHPSSKDPSLEDLLSVRPKGLEESELWALLCQSVQALQDLFLSDGPSERYSIPLVTPRTMKLSSKGRVKLRPPEGPSEDFTRYLAPEYRANKSYSDTERERMWVFALGETLKKGSDGGHSEISRTLGGMTALPAHCRSSIMHLLEVMSEYCKGRSRPFSHIIMDLYLEASEAPVSPPPMPRIDSDRFYLRPVKRVASRLYSDKKKGECLGPEFVIKSALPPKRVSMPESKGGPKKTFTVILLDGQKVSVDCSGNSVTASDLMQALVREDHLEDNFMLGLSALIAGDFVFLPADTKLGKSNYSTLYIRIRLFLASLRGLRSPEARHLLYLQLRRSILEHQLPSSFSQIVDLAGLALQAEFGDLQGLGSGDSQGLGTQSTDYFLLEHYVPETMLASADNERIKRQLVEAHGAKRGLIRAEAERQFVGYAQDLPHYGGHFYTATMDNRENVWLYISSRGIDLYERGGQTVTHQGPKLYETFEWKRIETLCYGKRYFTVVGSDRKKYKAKMEQKKSYYAFRLASLHHQFYLTLQRDYASLSSLSKQFGLKENGLLKQATSLEALRPPDKRRGVKMGTRAFMPEASRSMEMLERLSLDSMSFQCSSASSGDAYVLDTTTKSENILPDIREIVNRTFQDRLDNMSFAEERILFQVNVRRDAFGSLGLQVTEGSDGNVYVQSVIEGGPASTARPKILRGDQVVAVDGRSLLGRNYADALDILKGSGARGEFVLSRALVPKGQDSKDGALKGRDSRDKDRAVVVDVIPKRGPKYAKTLPRSMGLGRRWNGPVRYPVTPVKKDTDPSSSEEEQVFI